MTQFDKRNISMMMDLYEMTMLNGYFNGFDRTQKVIFDVFYRKNPDNAGFAIFAGLEQIVEYIENLHFEAEDVAYFRSLNLFDEPFLQFLENYRFTGDVYAFAEGTVIYPNEPIITVRANIMDAQIIETAVLNQINHQSLIATKACRIVRAANGRGLSDFGARRAHNVDAAVYGARAAYIGGMDSTSNVLAGQMFDIPVSGTMAHSWIMAHDNEYEAFKHYAEIYPDESVFLVDTFDVLKSGVPNAIKVAKEVLMPAGKRLKAIRLDSGDLAYLSKKARVVLDENGLTDCKIIATNSLDEYTITSVIEQGGKVDAFGVGERLLTAKSDPVFGAVYKISGIENNKVCLPKIKISETFEKITNPARKRVYRIYNAEGHAVADFITLYDEPLDFSKGYIDPVKPWRTKYFQNCTAKELQRLVIQNGKCVVDQPDLKQIRAYVKQQLDNEIWQEEQRFENPHTHYLDMSVDYYHLKMKMLDDMHSAF